MSKIERLLNLAARYAIAEDSREHWLSAIAVRNDGAIVHARNKSLTTLDYANYIIRINQHAEARLLPKLDIGATIYVARVGKKNRLLALAEPCSSCKRLLTNARVKKVYFTIDENSWGCWVP